MNPWTDSFEQYRQDILGEDKKKSDKQTKQRWQDDDGDNKWYEKSDVDGKISDREKKEKEKHYAKEDIADIIARLEKKRISKGGDPDESPLPSMKKYHEKKKKKVKEEVVTEKISASGYARAKKWREAQAAQKDRQDNAKWEEKARTHKWDGKTWNKRDKPTHDEGQGPHAKKLAAHNANNESVEVNHIDGSTTQIIDVVRAPAMVAAPKFSNWKEEMSYEALKGEKLDIEAEKGKVKNQVDINPTIKTEEKKKLIEGDKVKYYGGEDRDKKTGYPKGLKSSRKEKSDDKKDDNKKVDYTTMAQSYEPEGDMLVDEGKFSDAVQGGLRNINTAVNKAANTKVGKPIAGALKTVFGPWKKGDGGSNRKSATFDTHGPAHKGGGLLNQSYDPEGELIDEKKKGLDGKACWDGYKLAGTKKKGGKTVDNCVKEGDYHSGQGEKKQKRTLKWMKDRAKPGEDVGAPGLDAYKERQKDHEDKRGKKKVNEARVELDERLAGKGYKRRKDYAGRTVEGDWEGSDRGGGHKWQKRVGKPVKKKSPTYLAHVHNKEEVQVDEARVDKGRSDYGKASIRNYRRFGPGHGEPAMFDPENKRGKAIEKRREEGKERRGKKKAKVPAYKVEHHKKPGEEHPIDEIFGKKLTNYLGKGNIEKNVQVQPGQKDFVKSMPDPQVVRGGKTVVPGGETVSRWTKNNIKAMRGLNNSHEPEGEVLEATKYSKVKGKNYKSGKKSVKGGTAKGDLAYKTALANIIKQVGAGGVQQSSKQGKKKKGEKGRKQIGDRKFSPAETIRRKKASAKAAYAAMTDTRGT